MLSKDLKHKTKKSTHHLKKNGKLNFVVKASLSLKESTKKMKKQTNKNKP